MFSTIAMFPYNETSFTEAGLSIPQNVVTLEELRLCVKYNNDGSFVSGNLRRRGCY
jgi:hypothetical protein